MLNDGGMRQPAAMLAPPVEDLKDAQMGITHDLQAGVRSAQYMKQMLEQVIKMTQTTLGVEAASILLFRDNDQELYFEAASGPVGKVLRQVKFNSQYGIAGQVARTAKPLIVNDVARSENFHKTMDNATGFVTRSLICAPLILNRSVLGVIEALNKHDGGQFDEKDLDILMSIAETTAIAINNTRLHQTMLDTFHNTITVMVSAIEGKDTYLRGHSRRVMEYVLLACNYFSLTAGETEMFEYASLLHDIGKISIDSHVLAKSDCFSPREMDTVRQHPVTGAAILKEIPFLEKASEIVLYHHERYDGQGYPSGLKGETIPLGARLIAVADSFDTMTIDRAFRPAMNIERAIEELNKGTGTQFCPEAVKAFITGLHLNMRR